MGWYNALDPRNNQGIGTNPINPVKQSMEETRILKVFGFANWNGKQGRNDTRSKEFVVIYVYIYIYA